jgi:hypothetical protein
LAPKVFYSLPESPQNIKLMEYLQASAALSHSLAGLQNGNAAGGLLT